MEAEYMNQKKGFSKDFWLVVTGQIISLFGNAVMRFALPIHLLNVTGSAAVLGVVSGCAFIPLAVMSPIGGIIAVSYTHLDVYKRQPISIVTSESVLLKVSDLAAITIPRLLI